MSISCDCDYGDYDWYYTVEDNERNANSEGKCYGCCGQIHVGDEVRHIEQFEYNEDDEKEYQQLGRLCPVCSGLYDSLIELGFCLEADWGFITEAMDEYKREYK